MARLSMLFRLLPPVLLCLALWALAFRPLPLRMGASIPFSAHHAGAVETHALVPGDHLQLLYHFWLTRDMLAGQTPAFHNLYEFNTGVDSARRQLDPGYLPFSLVYAALSPWLGHAFGWNAAQLAALLVAFLFLNRLASRYTRGPRPPPADGRDADPRPALAATVLAMGLPYQWTNLAAGSPTGFGMACLPALALGLDVAVRDGRRRGGWLAGAALLACYTSDLHCFFFGALLTPAWCLLAWTASAESLLPTWRDARRLVRALWPTGVAGAVAVLVARHLQSLYATTDVAAGRSLADVLANSPARGALFGKILRGPDLHFQVGMALIAAVLLAAVAAFHAARTPRGQATARRAWLPVLLLCGGVAAVVLLALGLHGPFDGLPVRALRKVLPPYRMIRQPVKVFCLLPTLLTPLLTMGLGTLWQSPHPATRLRRGVGRLVVLLLVVATVASLAQRLRVGLCRLPPPNAAYEAVVRDAAQKGKPPHILALPIWPGDSAWSSLYEYRAMQGRIRMLNGYSPTRTEDYLENVFRRYESVTQGRLTEAQATALRASGVTAVVLHEEFPNVVSPFPVGATLHRLQSNPWLKPLAHAEGIWAFTLRDLPADPPSCGGAAPSLFSAARWWHWPETGTGDRSTEPVKAVLRSPIADWPDARWLMRTRGDGKLRIERAFKPRPGDAPLETQVDELSLEGKLFFARRSAGPSGPTASLLHQTELAPSNAVRWIALPLGELPNGGWATPVVKVVATEGAVHVSDLLLTAGPSSLAATVLRIPAVDFFRGGYIDAPPEGRPYGVVFRPTHDPAGDVLYGPHLPLSPGRWRLTVEGWGFTNSGELRVLLGDREVARGLLVDSGERQKAKGLSSVPLLFSVQEMEPLEVRFAYAGRREVRLDTVVLERVSEEP